jgi:hypothetical protein
MTSLSVISEMNGRNGHTEDGDHVRAAAPDGLAEQAGQDAADQRRQRHPRATDWG